MKRSTIIIFCLVLLNSRFGYSQELTTNYYSYVNNFYNLNPAYCAIGHKFAGIMDIRQRAVLNSTNNMLGISGMVGENQGAGGRLLTDTRGPFQVMIADATYGYKLGLDEKKSIYFGISAGLVNKSINTSKIKNFELLDADDPVLDVSNFKSTTFTSGAGLLYEFKSFEFSFSAPQLVGGNKKTLGYFNALAANIFYINESYEIIPMILYFNTPVLKNLVSVQCKGQYKRKITLQLGYQSNSMFNACLGYMYSDFGIAYNFMTSNKLMNVQTSGTHEVILTLRKGKWSNKYQRENYQEIEHVE